MQVLKFGGSSVANAANMSKTVDIVLNALEKDRTIAVFSAIAGCTDDLIKAGKLAATHDLRYKDILDDLRKSHHKIIRDLLPEENRKAALKTCDSTFDSIKSITQGLFLIGEISPTSLDAIQGCGELLSTRILALKFASMGIPVKWLDSRDIIRTNNVRGHNVVDTSTTYANIRQAIESNPLKTLFVAPGFIASDEKGRMTTLGRGGSDYSASLYALGSNARALETWKDVPGMMTANPKIVPEARPIHHISYRAALELSHFGAKVLYPPTIQPVVAGHIPIYVKCTFDPTAEGTLIEQNPPRGQHNVIGLTNSDNIALLSLEGSGMVGVPGFSSRLFQTLSENDISIILITQASSVNTMCVAVSEKDAIKAKQAADQTFAYEISLGKLNPLKVETGYSIVCLVGDDMFEQSGTTGRMLDALGRRSISVRAVAQGSSERNISVIVKSTDCNTAIHCIHDEFFIEDSYKHINLFIAGYGNVGRTLIDMIAANRDTIAARTGIRLHIAGITNSRRYVIDLDGIDPASVASKLETGEDASSDAFFEQIQSLSMQNSIFVDCTANSDISSKYPTLLRAGYDIVACNKIAFSAPLPQYKALREAAVESKRRLRYETTVGSAMPILETIDRCINSGDDIIRIESVLSGTINYIFNSYRGGTDGKTFADIVRDAHDKGFTEPDPRLDLGGRDVLRKLIILGREAGIPLEETDIDNNPILGKETFKGSTEDFYTLLEQRESNFAALWREADSEGKILKYLATLEKDGGKWHASISLKKVSRDHPLGSDGGAVITTRIYPSPIIIRGAGAGAENTASGVLNDILKS